MPSERSAPGDEHGELVAAEARRRGRRRGSCAQAVGDEDQRAVAAGMPVLRC